MKRGERRPPTAAELRRSAELRLSERDPGATADRSGEDLRRLVHELQVHQIELEMQNEELCRIKEGLEEARQEYADLYDFAPVGYVTLDPKGAIRGANLTGAGLLGVERSRLLGRTLAGFVSERSGPAFAACLDQVFAGAAKVSCEVELGKNGVEPLFVRIEAVAGGDGTVCRAALVDISDRRRSEEALQRATAAAEAANRAKSDFLARMSHELRTPLNGITGMIELALREGPAGSAKEYLHLARTSANALLDIVNDLLDLAKIEARRVELVRAPFELAAALRSVVGTFQAAAAEKGLELCLELDPGVPPWVVGDEGRLRQVLVNLLGNAVKFTEGGAVHLRVTQATAQKGGAGESPEAEARLLFTVSDTGIGIPPEQRDAIFESFVQGRSSSHAKYGGTGLGLSISKHLVELGGGRLWVESEPSAGSAFSFTAELPVAEGPGAAAAMGNPVPAGLATPPLRVLLAEDNPLNRLFLKTILAQGGHAVAVAGDGRAAVEALSRAPFDVALLDVRMPELDGLAVARLVRQGQVTGCPADLPLVAVTAHALAGDRERFLAAGLDDYLSKPIDLEELDRVLARWAGRGMEEGPVVQAGADSGRERLDDLLARLPPATVWRLVEMFLEQIQPGLDALVGALERDDAGALAEEAHRLRGSWTVLPGSGRMVELAEALERCGEEGEMERARAWLQELLAEATGQREGLEAALARARSEP